MKSILQFRKQNLVRVGFFCILMAPLFFYYILEFEIPNYFIVMLFVIWVILLILHMGITTQNRHLIIHHEVNLVFRSLYEKYSIVKSVVIQISIEVSFVFLMSFLFEKTNYVIDFQASSIIAGIISILHFIAYYSNKKTIRILQKYQNHHL